MRAKLSLSLLSIVAAIAAAVMLMPGPAAAESTWDQIKRTGKLRYGAVDYPPNWYRDKTSGKWTGFLVEMVEDVAKEMGVEAFPWRRLGPPASSTFSPIKPTCNSGCRQRRNGHW